MINQKRYENYFYAERPSWFLNPEMSGGGMTINVGAHHIERIVRYGGDIRNVRAFALKIGNCPVEGHINAIFELDGNVTASIGLNGYSSVESNELEIICEKGIIKSSAGRPFIEIITKQGAEKIDLPGETNPFALQLMDFHKCAAHGESLIYQESMGGRLSMR